MRHLAAFALLLAAGCSDPAADAPDALRGTCGDAGPGMQWINQPGCTSTCSLVNGSLVNETCRPDAGAAYCAPTGTDVHNCGRCFNDCVTGSCRPAGGVTYTATCQLGMCRCASP